MPAPLNRIIALFTWAAYVRKHSGADVLSCHDLPALFIGCLSQIGKRRKAKLIYDSHELEIGRAAKRNRLQTWGVTQMERFLSKRCAFSILANGTAADIVQRIHHLKRRPVVARNIPPYWTLEPEKMQAARQAFLNALNAPEDAFLVMYHGIVVPYRGVEGMLRAISRLSGVYGVILGNGADDYLDSLKALCGELGIENRVLFHPAVPIEELRNYVGASNVGIIVLSSKPKFLSYYLALPNKFFENVQSLVPIIVGQNPEMIRLIERYQIGSWLSSDSPENLASAIARMRDDREFYQLCKQNLKRAKEELCWENEKKALLEAYQEILQ